jgi:protein SCO1/2
MNKKFLVAAMVLLLVIVAITIAIAWNSSANPPFSGSLITPPKPAPDFKLTSQTNENVSLSDFRGKYVLIYFGFTNCTDECPLTMGYMKQMRDRLGTLADQTQVILITSDPARDTPEVLGKYLSHFDPSFVGLTSSLITLQKVWVDYGVTVMADGETHSSYLYLIDPQGEMIASYPLLQNVDGITADLEHLIREQ